MRSIGTILSIICVLAAAGLAICVAFERQACCKLDQENKAWRQQLSQMDDFIAENQRLSNLVTQANVIPPGGAIQNSIVVNGSATLDCAGVPTSTYAVQRATDVHFAQNLATLLTTNAPANSRFRCTDSSPPSAAAFYRLLSQ